MVAARPVHKIFVKRVDRCARPALCAALSVIPSSGGMGAGASIAHELSVSAPGQRQLGSRNSNVAGHNAGPVESQYNEMVEHLGDVSGAACLSVGGWASKYAVLLAARLVAVVN